MLKVNFLSPVSVMPVGGRLGSLPKFAGTTPASTFSTPAPSAQLSKVIGTPNAARSLSRMATVIAGLALGLSTSACGRSGIHYGDETGMTESGTEESGREASGTWGMTGMMSADDIGTGETGDQCITECNNPDDSDCDGLSDSIEIQINTNPFNPDTDGDGICDGFFAIYNVCNAGPDCWPLDELLGPGDSCVEMKSPDTDGDGWSDQAEEAMGFDPLTPDTDGDGVTDGADCDPLNVDLAFNCDAECDE